MFEEQPADPSGGYSVDALIDGMIIEVEYALNE